MAEIKSGQDLNFVTALQQAVYLIRERNQLNGHNDPVFSVGFSPDGQTIASASGDKTVNILEA